MVEEEDTMDTADAASVGSPGQLDAEIVDTVRKARGVEKVDIRTDATGKVTKLAVYHTDADRIPAAVRDLAKSRYPGAVVTSYETELYENGERVYEVEVRPKKGKPCELAATASGEELYTECQIAPSDLPAAITDALEKLLPGAKIEEAERKTGKQESYSIEATAGGAEHYLYFLPDGTLDRHFLRVPATVQVPVD